VRFFALKAGLGDAAMLSHPSNFMAEDAAFCQLIFFVKVSETYSGTGRETTGHKGRGWLVSKTF
jgi:hypothetical protein